MKNSILENDIAQIERALLAYENTTDENLKKQHWLKKYLQLTLYLNLASVIDKFNTKKVPDALLGLYPAFKPINLSPEKDSFLFKEIRLPLPISQADEMTLVSEAKDLILPYIAEDRETVNLILTALNGEGPYEIDENVCLRKDDVVIVKGANMGIFSAIASVKSCNVYAFEPFPYVIENYLAKTAAWHKNITVCQYALWHTETVLNFTIDYGNIGSSNVLDISKPENTIQVQAVKLDDFVRQNNIARVDFIKADIEGAERNMLVGAKNILKEFAPKLSLCTYHLADDAEVFREIILKANPKYKIKEEFHKMYAYV